MSHHAKDWKGTLRQSIAHLKAIEIVEAAEVGSGGMGEWSKERTNWKIQIVSIARGVSCFNLLRVYYPDGSNY